MGPVRSAVRSIAYTASAFALLLSAACGGGNDGNAPTGPTGTAIAIVAGNFQLAKYGTSVAIAPAVKVTGANGPVAGVQVTFAPVTGSGTVTGGTVTTDANGVATVGSWTLSPAPGVNTLKATAGTLTVNISATAVAGAPATISIKVGNNQNGVERSRLPNPVQVEVTDGTYPIRGVQVDFAVASGGGSVDVPNQTTNIDGLATVGGWKLGNAGVNTVTATVRGTALTTTFTATAAVLQISTFTKVEGDNQTGAFYGNIAPKRATVEVRNQYNDPAEGVVVTFSVLTGGGTIVKAVDTTGTNGQAEVGTWRLGASASQSISAAATAETPPAPLTFSATAVPVPASAFKIEVRYPDGEPSAEIKAAFDAAAAKWSSIVVGDLEDIVIAGTDTMGPVTVSGNACIPVVVNQTIDDLVIFAYVKPIDGARGVLGFATPIFSRNSDSTTISGCMTFDVADMEELAAAGALQATITHEMGHVLGIGTLWDAKKKAANTCASGNPTTKPYFTGSSARQAFRSALGAGVVWSDSMVPLEGTGACFDGTRDAHPSEGIFKNELMTGYIDQFSNPLSVVSASMLRDLGMTVNDLATDAYTLPYGLSAARMTAAEGRKLNEMAVDEPIRMLDRRGRTMRIVER
jgi:hypothetical protein